MVGTETCVTKGDLVASGADVVPEADAKADRQAEARGEKSERFIVAMRPHESAATPRKAGPVSNCNGEGREGTAVQ